MIELETTKSGIYLNIDKNISCMKVWRYQRDNHMVKDRQYSSQTKAYYGTDVQNILQNT